ncbi:hypothetical protein FNV43_RR00757 [Rhamnella rubrinervis]|uniref:Leucine-rich repeat-containing N-terminal plant-type domain-containing protein n=1 Tax=Rhamnella rubrinervis TaxID=2594499 RepID=A0A8K0MS88_9ROSA|nr:hypothetical protein FNV43_RR00757 [Rhamnella rubrinervis]
MRTHLLFAWLFLMLVDLQAVSDQCRLSHQQSLLLKLKDSLLFNATSSKILVKWNESSDYCTWEGVTCEEGCVTGLKLSNESISGGIDNSGSLFNLRSLKTWIWKEWVQALSFSLPKLRVLSLAACYLSGLIDQSLAKLEYLSVIRLDFNNLSAPIPRFFANFTNLTSLSLVSCGLYGTFPNEIFQCSSKPGDYHDKFHGVLPTSIGNLQNLSRLQLPSCLFNGTLPNSMAKLIKLVYLDLSYNNFSGPIPSFNKNLTHIDLSSNGLTGPIPSTLWEGLLNLADVNLGYNFLNGNIPSSLFALPSLQSIELAFNQFSGPIAEFPNAPFSKLYYVDLRSNNLNGPIPMSIFKLRKLGALLLSSNEFNGTIQLHMFQGLRNLFNLDLSHNNLSFNVTETSNSNFTSLPSILDLHSNQLRGKIPVLPPYATYIDLSSNSFTSPISVALGNNAGLLSYISLANNGLTGVIPKAICNSESLQVLDLSNNSFNGRIPTCILTMRRIFEVDLRGNRLSGQIPDSFSVNCGLQTLDLNGNLLTDGIPKSLVNCTALEFLDLGNNHLHDTFPMSLKSIVTLRVLVLRSNKLYGHITCSESIGSWRRIQIVDVASNNFSGELPGQCLTKWNVMVDFEDDTNPRFDPRILDIIPYILYSKYYPSVMNKGLKMELVKIPTGFTAIDFSSNNFHGEVPNELGQLKSLIVLNFSNNALGGEIPSSFGNLSQLESLDLSRNHINGTIPASLSNLNFLSVLNLSNNQLFGRIPKGNQLQTFAADSFQGNIGLCGPPLTSNCTDNVAEISPDTPIDSHSTSDTEIEWNFISFEVGFIAGFGIVICPLMFWKRWRKYYFDRVEDIAYNILPQLLLRKWWSWKMGVRKVEAEEDDVRNEHLAR